MGETRTLIAANLQRALRMRSGRAFIIDAGRATRRLVCRSPAGAGGGSPGLRGVAAGRGCRWQPVSAVEAEDPDRVAAERRGDLVAGAARLEQRLLQHPGVLLHAGHAWPVGPE